MTYAQQELESEFNGRLDYMRELAVTEAAELPGYDYEAEARQDATAQLLADFERLVDTLDVAKFNKLEAWVAAQLPEEKTIDENADERLQGEREAPDFTCTDCAKNFYLPHEGNFGREEDLSNLCVDCHITRLVAIPSVQ